ncbi:MAG: UDP-N-acetylmuramoyl-L-alanine--D-glutamate ligase [Flavobacterium sp.]|jgi:UDP-N-acetylmuramoylalanine--D-glutamate ligase|uniref:UDP-N-acetylmuramoyl-L-alanine--D-glutamate ligase n=1 Tax=Flavobacterium sp. TaxID=239 RepID=UPI001B4877D4|nr:UDP-N-acetylmuramoyl-L-alanine--D-glutamate ligase [Flavobacterium sp.]MBP9848485.1 UDP-N-acetylmuramoyl-L-alanine--D-glutamate ligase [Flavobacterium sp.]TAF09972.1 MAG: UDP-N-acetylmuramoyl-L-alanine--D-glutamate ligase [Flavobacteriia bacterium]WRH74368.1 MAG: UDP-N-acetylmuramoyl-L-alanine--D-glutamate ligase [Flavobacterium sp.]
MRLVILGGGESGVGTAILGQQKGYDVFVSDFGKIKENYKEVLSINGIAWEDEKHTEELILNADLVMKSPGIPEKAPIVKKLIEKEIPVISEIELAVQFTDATTIGITGSNGKTTTTLLTYHLLKEAGLNVGLAGNIGKSFAWQVAENKHDIYVLELSSFQLDGIINYKPHIAIIMNISPDHLDRYNYDYNLYIGSKFRITKNQTEADYLIYDNEDEAIQNWLKNNKIKANKVPFSLITKPENQGAFLEDNNINSTINKELFTMPINELALEGKHNIKNAMAATAVAQLLNIRKQTIRESLTNFQGVEHRLEKVLKIQGVQYINDSKATNVNSVFYALDSMTTPTVWIVGGVDKGNDYDELMPLVREKVKAIVCLGVDNTKIINAFNNVVDVMVETTSMSEAVQLAQRLAEKGDSVLLSPACASFDLFENYEDRGQQFKQAIFNL